MPHLITAGMMMLGSYQNVAQGTMICLRGVEMSQKEEKQLTGHDLEMDG